MQEYVNKDAVLEAAEKRRTEKLRRQRQEYEQLSYEQVCEYPQCIVTHGIAAKERRQDGKEAITEANESNAEDHLTAHWVQ